MTVRKRLLVGPEESKAVDIALRSALGLTVSDSDRRYLARNISAVSNVWTQVNAFRNYYSASGEYETPAEWSAEAEKGYAGSLT